MYVCAFGVRVCGRVYMFVLWQVAADIAGQIRSDQVTSHAARTKDHDHLLSSKSVAYGER